MAELDIRSAQEQARKMHLYVESFNGQKFSPALNSVDRQNLAVALDNLMETATMLGDVADRLAAAPPPAAAQQAVASRYSFVCNAGCGVCAVKVTPFEYERTETLEGEHIGSKYRPHIVSSCCGSEVHVYDNDADAWGAQVALAAPAAAQGAVSAEDQWIEQTRHLNCPVCNGSGHVEDVLPQGDAAQRALLELLLLKDMKDKWEAEELSGFAYKSTDNHRLHNEQRANYLKRKPLAWEAARKALAAPSQAGAQQAVAWEDASERYLADIIDRAPEPLRRLGDWLSKRLDEDEWKTAERFVLGAEESIAPTEKSDGWLPIEQAPKDGTELLLTNGMTVQQGWWMEREGGIKEHRDTDGRYLGQDEDEGYIGWWDVSGGMQPEPTHYQPLPATPKAAEKSGRSE